MNYDPDEATAFKKAIRASMDLKETDELIDIWLAHDTNDWTPEALEVVGQLLVERGEDLNSLTQEEEEEPAPLIDEVNLDNLPNWASDAIRMESSLQIKPGKKLSSSKEEEREDEWIECIRCNARIPWDSKFCPQCGLDLYPESTGEDEAE
jgi:hypothetical protein